MPSFPLLNACGETMLSSVTSIPVGQAFTVSTFRRADLVTRIEIIVAPDGTIKQMGVLRSSGQRAFDIAVLDSVDRARPFTAPPDEIRSPDGNVYLHWEFHRDPKHACSTQGARPFVLR